MSSFCTAHFFSKKFQHICVSLNVNFNESLTNDVVSFKQLGPGFFFVWLLLPESVLYTVLLFLYMNFVKCAIFYLSCVYIVSVQNKKNNSCAKTCFCEIKKFSQELCMSMTFPRKL